MLLLLWISVVNALELPRGVPFSKSAFYRIGTPFSCLDGSATVPWTKVNDDYCDCMDGSDEPGTSACSNGVFFCRDVQYKVQSIQSAFVNDGICDCCDGSDEYDGRTTCESTCGVLAAAVQQAKSIKRNEIEQGHKLFKEYVEQLKIRMEKEEQERAAAEEAAKLSAVNESTPEVTTTPVSDPTPPVPAADQPTPSSEANEDVPYDTHSPSDDSSVDNAADDSSAEEVDDHDPTPSVPSIPKPEPTPIDYGPESAFRMLDDLEKCIELPDGQYTYELCGLREVFQREGSEHKISLGKWTSWAFAEDDVLKENKYGVMLFQNGLTCWNGPARSTKVYVHCGAENELINVAEPSRCEYVMHLRTPAACFEEPDVLFKRLHPED